MLMTDWFLFIISVIAIIGTAIAGFYDIFFNKDLHKRRND